MSKDDFCGCKAVGVPAGEGTGGVAASVGAGVSDSVDALGDETTGVERDVSEPGRWVAKSEARRAVVLAPPRATDVGEAGARGTRSGTVKLVEEPDSGSVTRG